MTKFRWTDRKPDRPGWWWYREQDEDGPYLVIHEVSVRRGRLRVHDLSSGFRNGLDGYTGQWSDGPIEPPGEPGEGEAS